MKSDTLDLESVNQKFKSSCAVFYYVKKIVEFELNNNQLLKLNEKYILLTTNPNIQKLINSHKAKTKGYTKKIIYEPKTVKNGDTISVNTI